MKKLYSLLFIFSSLLFYSQELEFEGVVKVDSLTTKEELYSRARTWAKENYSNKNSLITSEDMNLGVISGLGSYDYRATKKYMGFSCVEGHITYKFNIYVKEGRYKYIFHSFNHSGSRGPGCRRVDYGKLTTSEKAPIEGKMIADDYAWYDIKDKTRSNIESLISKLEEELSKKSKSSSNW